MEQKQATYLKRTARLARGDMPDVQKVVGLLLKTYGKPRNAQLVLENALRRVHFSREDFHVGSMSCIVYCAASSHFTCSL